MAIDTNNKKFALITYQQPFNTPVPISADGLGQDDKQHLIWQYPGILWVIPLIFLQALLFIVSTGSEIAIKKTPVDLDIKQCESELSLGE